jgi:hypothetical protein
MDPVRPKTKGWENETGEQKQDPGAESRKRVFHFNLLLRELILISYVRKAKTARRRAVREAPPILAARSPHAVLPKGYRKEYDYTVFSQILEERRSSS